MSYTYILHLQGIFFCFFTIYKFTFRGVSWETVIVYIMNGFYTTFVRIQAEAIRPEAPPDDVEMNVMTLPSLRTLNLLNYNRPTESLLVGEEETFL